MDRERAGDQIELPSRMAFKRNQNVSRLRGMDANELYVLTLGPGEALVYPRADLAESFGLFVHSMVSTQVNAPARNVRHFLRPAENH